MAESSSPFDSAYLEQLRQQMLSFAKAQLRDLHQAEDVVQEALLGALRNQDRFAGRSAFKTWVFGILKHKIVDAIRLRQRRQEISAEVLSGDDGDASELSLFDRKGHWTEEAWPSSWKDPDQSLQDEHFWSVFELCMQHLPGVQGRAFMMRTLLGLETSEIAEELNVTENNLNVLLHRARLRLRDCIETGWFNDRPVLV